MKKVLSTAILCMLVSMTFAQKKNVKDAKKAMDSGKFSEARSLIQPAFTDPETATDPETWKIAGDIEYKAYDTEMNKIRNAINPGTPDYEIMYSGLYDSYSPYIISDSLGELPDEKGKVKNKFRKDIVNKMKASHPDYYNGGAHYTDNRNYSKAADFFERYWELPSLTMFQGDADMAMLAADTSFQIIKYYAAISAIQAKEHPRAIRLLNKITEEQFVPNSTYQESDVYELLTSEYLQVGDSARYQQVLEAGAAKYPKSNYFVPNLINQFIRKREFDKALTYLDQAIANDASNSCDFYSVKASIYAERGDFDNSFASYNNALRADANCERAMEGLAVAYVVKAQDLRDEAAKAPSRKEQMEIDEQAVEYYKMAYPLLEKYKSLLEARNADNSEIKAALYKLRNVYYNLNMDNEFDAATEAYESL